MPDQSRLSPREKQRRYRARLRARGLRPVQIWVPDSNAPGFAAECKRQSLLLNASREEQDIQEFIEHAADWDDG